MKKSTHLTEKVYSIADLQLTTCADEEQSTMFVNTLNKLFPARRRAHHSTLDLTREASSEIHLIQLIGQGRFGIVYKALYHIRPNENLIVAVRKSSFIDDALLKRLAILKKFTHPNIIQYYGIVQSMVLMEYAHCQSLRQCLRSSDAKSNYPLGTLFEYFKQILSALCYLEEEDFLPHELNWQMVLVFHSSLVKLSDLEQPARSICSSLVQAFARLMCLCLNYGDEVRCVDALRISGEIDGMANLPSSSRTERLLRPCYASTELDQFISHSFRSPSLSFAELNETLQQIELEEIQVQDISSTLIVLDRDSDRLRCVTNRGEILFIDAHRVQSSTKDRPSLFQRRTVIKKPKMKPSSRRTTNLLDEVMEAYTAMSTKRSADTMTTSSSICSPSSSYSSYSSICTDLDDSHSISSEEIPSSHPYTGQPLPPPPDLSTLGRKLTTATLQPMSSFCIVPNGKKTSMDPHRFFRRFHFFS